MTLEKFDSSSKVQYIDNRTSNSDVTSSTEGQNEGDEKYINKNDLITEFLQVRKKTLELFKPLKVEDTVIQSDSFGSPPNWHIAHVELVFSENTGKT